MSQTKTTIKDQNTGHECFIQQEDGLITVIPPRGPDLLFTIEDVRAAADFWFNNEQIDPIRISDLKCWPDHFADLESGAKTFDIRNKKPGRKFYQGQIVIMREWDPISESYTGSHIPFAVDYVMDSDDLPKEYGLEMENCYVLGLRYPIGIR